MREAADAWRVEWLDGSSRETPLTAMVKYAREFDPLVLKSILTIML